MGSSLTRRQFVVRSSQFAAGSLAIPMLSTGLQAEEKQAAFCLACRDANLKATGAPDIWSAMKAIGAGGVEAAVGDDLSLSRLFHPERKYTVADAAGIDAVLRDAKAAGGRITALCMSNHFDERPDFEIEWCTKTAKAAQAMGVKAIRIDVVPRKLKRDQFLDFAVETLKKLIAATASTGAVFAIENHGNTTNDPEFLGPLFDRVGSDRLGLTLDTGNFYWYGHPLSKVYELFERFAPRAFHTHCKSIGYPAEEREKQRPMGWEYGKYHCPIDQGDIDFRRVVSILRKAGYTGDLCIENEALGKFPADERTGVLAREIRYLQGIVAG